MGNQGSRLPFIIWHIIVLSAIYLAYRYYGDEQNFVVCVVMVIYGTFRLYLLEKSKNND